MPRRVLVQRDNESVDLIEVPAPNEHHLQEVLKASPQLVPTEDLGLDGELLVVGRETTLASGYIDLLCLSRSGEVVLIEFKTGPQNPDFRHALAQVIDYGSDLWRMSVDEFDRGVVQRYLSGGRAESRFAGARDLRDAIARLPWTLTDEELDATVSRLADVLTTGDFHYVVAAQRFTPSMATSLEYLNSTMRFGRFFLIEIIQLEGAGLTANSAQAVARPPKRSAGASATSGDRANEAEFLAGIDDAAYRDAVARRERQRLPPAAPGRNGGGHTRRCAAAGATAPNPPRSRRPHCDNRRRDQRVAGSARCRPSPRRRLADLTSVRRTDASLRYSKSFSLTSPCPVTLKT